MKRQDYYPARIGDQIVWLRNFKLKLLGTPASGGTPAVIGYATTLHLDATKAAAIGLDVDNAVYALDAYRSGLSTASDAVYQRIDDLLSNDALPGLVAWIGFTPPPGAPAAVGYGALKRVFAYISDVIRKAAGYDTAIGQDLGIEGAEMGEPDEAATTPDFSLRTTMGAKLEVVWTKGRFDGVKLEFDRGAAGLFADFDLKPNYTLNWLPAAGTAVNVKVRLRYLYKGEDFGNWSEWQSFMLAAV